MGREVRRVPVDFDWPLEKIWEGFVNPLGDFPPCPDCSYEHSPTIMDRLFPIAPRGTGRTPEAYAVEQTFYSHQIASAVGSTQQIGPNTGAETIAWHNKLGQKEVDNLIKEGRLKKWVDGKYESVPLTAAEVNAAQSTGADGIMGHDGINRWILVRFRCDQLGIEMNCKTCDGNGDIASKEDRDAYENWEGFEPPVGDGWQVWETVSEGSPITPVFATAEDLVDYLATKGTTWDQKSSGFAPARGPWRREAAEQFVKDEWAPSFITQVGGPEGNKFFDGARDADALAETRKQ